MVVERTQPADPLVLNSFQFVTNITPTFSTTLVPSPSQLLLRGGDGVHQGPSEVGEGSVVPWATILEMFVSQHLPWLHALRELQQFLYYHKTLNSGEETIHNHHSTRFKR